MADDLLVLAIGYVVLKALATYQDEIVPAIQQKGADLYDQLHPKETQHRNDLPGKQLTKAQIEDLARRAGFNDPHVAMAIAMAESGGVPNALGDFRDGKPLSIGLWQINTRAHPKYARDKLSNPEYNADAAWEISKGGFDWKPWSTWWKDPVKRTGPGEGSYKRYL